MEWLKQMSLKKSFFCLTMLFLFAALMLSTLSILGISMLLQQYGTPLEMKIDGNGAVIPPSFTAEIVVPPWYHALGIFQIALPIIFVAAGLLSAGFVFYRMKIKKPLSELLAGAERIMKNDLDFSIHTDYRDELGQLCNSFEKMRLELLKNNRELWRRMEERKRLNAAFSHELRNPVTVLKGSAKMLKKGLEDGTMSTANAVDSVTMIQEYTGRIETFIEAMSRVQKLEELQCSPKKVILETAVKELTDCVRVISMESGIEAEVKSEDVAEKLQKELWLDKAAVFNVAENLIANAARFAKSKILVGLRLNEEMLELSVQDDGPGFPQEILQKGAQPFFRGGGVNEDGSHFGIGLYVCRLLCEKHNGSLELKNTSIGALATAKFK